MKNNILLISLSALSCWLVTYVLLPHLTRNYTADIQLYNTYYVADQFILFAALFVLLTTLIYFIRIVFGSPTLAVFLTAVAVNTVFIVALTMAVRTIGFMTTGAVIYPPLSVVPNPEVPGNPLTYLPLCLQVIQGIAIVCLIWLCIQVGKRMVKE